MAIQGRDALLAVSPPGTYQGRCTLGEEEKAAPRGAKTERTVRAQDESGETLDRNWTELRSWSSRRGRKLVHLDCSEDFKCRSAWRQGTKLIVFQEVLS